MTAAPLSMVAMRMSCPGQSTNDTCRSSVHFRPSASNTSSFRDDSALGRKKNNDKSVTKQDLIRLLSIYENAVQLYDGLCSMLKSLPQKTTKKRGVPYPHSHACKVMIRLAQTACIT